MIVRLAAVSAALVLGLSACGTETEAPPEEPGAAAGQPGAEQFAGQWVDALNEATESGDTEELRTLAAAECAACTDFADQLDTIYGKDGRVESDGWEITKMVPEAGGTDDDVTLLMTVDASPQRVFASADADAKEFEGGQQAFRITVMRSEGAWRVTELEPR